MDRTEVIRELHKIVDHCLLGEGVWPADAESLPALYKKFRTLGLDEEVPTDPGTTQSTRLGKEPNFELILAFVGAYEMWSIPGILEANGYITELEAMSCMRSIPVGLSASSVGMCIEHISHFASGPFG